MNVEAQLRKTMRTDAGMRRLLDVIFGVGKYAYDPTEDVWVCPNKDHKGPGRGFIVVKRGGDWFTAVLPDEVLA
jgi:hypothetical protein